VLRPTVPGAVTPDRRVSEASQGFAKTLAALVYAEQLHAGQRREADGAPFILHLIEVCCLLDHARATDHVIAAGVLHDTIEKTAANAAELRARFGTRIATLVLAVSEDQSIVGSNACNSSKSS
jgi:(p)ppGpp synthase/HD superfamily hydrolase